MFAISPIIGMVSGTILLIIGIMLEGQIINFWSLSSLFIVLGGAVASTVVSFPIKKIIGVFKYSSNIFKSDSKDMNDVISNIVDLATRARKDGLLSLEDVANSIEDRFLKKGLLLVVDATDPELTKDIMETDIVYLNERHKQGRAVFESLSATSPAYGMVGTLIGLINMLQTLSDPSSLGPNMSVALITTFYGVVFANLFFTPIANQLSRLNDEEVLEKTIILEGILSIQGGENPRIIQEKLESFLSNTESENKVESHNEHERE